jgi:hypothetical protein
MTEDSGAFKTNLAKSATNPAFVMGRECCCREGAPARQTHLVTQTPVVAADF